MEREIKFRFWGNFGELKEEEDICEMEMLYGNKFHFFESEPINDLFSCRNFKVMQYTCLKDKNGKEIYEGDIVNIEHYSSQKKVIVEIDEDGVFPLGYKYSEWDGYYPQTAEIIGNIYENPELLK